MKKLLLTFLLLTSHGVLAQTKSWTVLIYWAVDNDLYEFSIPYLEQFTRIPKSSNLNLVLEYDYPADNYMLIIASHGSNWSGVIDDTTSKSYMSLTSLRGALKRINSALPSWADICEEWRR